MPRCKNCKEKFEPKTFLQKYCFKDECMRVFVEKTKEKAWKEKKQKMQQDLETVQDYIKMAQIIFNKYIRLRDKGQVCISCQKTINGVSHASHYLSAGGHSNVRFNEDNVWVSCYKCNVMLSGNQVEYRKALIKKIGIERVEWLEDNGSIERKFTKEELKEIMAEYKKKIKELELYQKE
jgi:ribosome-binding protein aMBF1 (putative translation factor)